MIGFLDDNAPSPEEEFAEEIKAYEKEETEKASKAEQEAAAAETEVDEDVEEVEAESNDDEQEVSAESESEGAEETEATETEADSRPGRQVPLTALQAERAKTSQLQRQFDEMNGQMQTLMKMYQPQQPGAEQQQDIAPNPEEDPIGAIEWTKRSMAAMQQQLEQQTANQTRTVQEQKLAEICNRNASEFAKATPDYEDAYRHLMQSRISELRLQGMDDESIGSTIRGEEQALAVSSLQQNINPAARVYDLAKARGFTGKANPTAAPKFDPDIEEKKKSASLNTGRGNPPKGTVSDKDLANMTGDAFDKNWEKVFGKSNKSFV